MFSSVKKVKVLHLIKSLGRGGAEKLIPETVKFFDQDKFEFYCIYFYHKENNIIDELESVGINILLIPSSNLRVFNQVGKVSDFVHEVGIDIIHAHLPWGGILARLVSRKTKIPLVYTEHNTWDRYNRISYWLNRLTFTYQDVAIAVSREVELSINVHSCLTTFLQKKRLKTIHIHNGIDTGVFKKDNIARAHIRADLDIPTDAFVIGKIAVFRIQKRLHIWIEQAVEIIKSGKNVHFILVGDGGLRDQILLLISNSGYESKFHLVGLQKQVVPYLSAMDLYLSSSEFEGLPVAMLEAMSCSLPVVATRVGGIGEVVQHGYEGLLCEVTDYHQLAYLCIEIIDNPSLLDKISKNSRYRVENYFSIQKMVSQIEEVYRGLI